MNLELLQTLLEGLRKLLHFSFRSICIDNAPFVESFGKFHFVLNITIVHPFIAVRSKSVDRWVHHNLSSIDPLTLDCDRILLDLDIPLTEVFLHSFIRSHLINQLLGFLKTNICWLVKDFGHVAHQIEVCSLSIAHSCQLA